MQLAQETSTRGTMPVGVPIANVTEPAAVVKLANTRRSGRRALTGLEVRVLSAASSFGARSGYVDAALKLAEHGAGATETRLEARGPGLCGTGRPEHSAARCRESRRRVGHRLPNSAPGGRWTPAQRPRCRAPVRAGSRARRGPCPDPRRSEHGSRPDPTAARSGRASRSGHGHSTANRKQPSDTDPAQRFRATPAPARRDRRGRVPDPRCRHPRGRRCR